ncbi:hypothetical protein [Aliamphritea ceti]|uniref:hypothetical protein n=1 Tax=Aliamphritea ceti TaxID=1524258 RepID=UPI0021C30156|nr:hypothetical protein [Aliamphritea ceti]
MTSANHTVDKLQDTPSDAQLHAHEDNSDTALSNSAQARSEQALPDEANTQESLSMEALAEETDSAIQQRTFGIYWLILVAASALLILLPQEAQWVTTKRGWYTQPMVGPAIGLSVLVIFTAARLFISFRLIWLRSIDPIDSLMDTLSNYRVALFSSALFFLYINTLSVFGFALATLLFVSTLLWLSRLLNLFWFGCAIGTTAALILIFRIGVSVWLPDVWLYELLPETLASFANQYL